MTDNDVFMKPLIFIVDDDMFFRKYITSVLVSNGFDNLQTFSSAEDSIQQLHQSPDVIIVDQELKGMSGIDLLNHLQNTKQRIPFIMVSGEDDQEIISKVIKLGAMKYIKKDEMLVNHLKDYFESNYQKKALKAQSVK